MEGPGPKDSGLHTLRVRLVQRVFLLLKSSLS